MHGQLACCRLKKPVLILYSVGRFRWKKWNLQDCSSLFLGFKYSEGRAINWLVDWSLDWLLDWSFDWSLDWLIDWSLDWSLDWLIDWLVDWLIVGRSIDWLIGWLRVILFSSPDSEVVSRWTFGSSTMPWNSTIALVGLRFSSQFSVGTVDQTSSCI